MWLLVKISSRYRVSKGRRTRKNSLAKDSLVQKLLQATYMSAAPEDGRIYLQDIYRTDVAKLKSIIGRSSIPWPNFIEKT